MEKAMSIATKALYLLASTAAFGFLGYAGRQITKGMELDGSARGIVGLVYATGNLLITTFGAGVVGNFVIVAALFGGIFAAILILRDPML